jgi:threonine dehydrogenase-like Zn-dependent dehydrogenase
MHALTFHGKGKIKYESIADPRIESPGDVIIEVTLTTVCGSDLHVYHEREKGLDHGTAMGHEFIGEIVEVGGDVRTFEKGDRVMCPFTTNCGECFYCRIGLTCRCVHGQLFGWVQGGKGLHGGQAELVRIPMADSTLMRIPEGITDEEALFLCDIFPTGYFCADRAEIEKSGTYVIVGSGPVGLMAVVGAIEHGAENLYSIDRMPYRLEHASRLGATPLDPSKSDPIEAIRDETDGRGADAVLEAVGTEEAARLAFDLVRPGGIISTVGVHSKESYSFSLGEGYDKNVTFRIGRCPARHYMERLIPLVQEKRYDIASIISHRMPLSEGAHAYKIFDNKQDRASKILLEP